MNNAQYWIDKLNLSPHPEGGYFQETYRSKEMISENCLPDRYSGQRAFGTAIYFLLEKDTISAFHRIKSDELWFFHTGDPIEIFILKETGLETIILGDNPGDGASFQAFLPAGEWFAARLKNKQKNFALMSCTVHPGFDFDDFELAKRKDLETKFPDNKELIRELSYE